MLNWGVIGLGRIAQRFCESLSHFDEACFYAGASHNPKKRQQFKELYHPEKLYDDYMKLLEDENVDIVYIALPHASHYKYALEAMKHHKAVLVEKPATLTSKEIRTLCEYSEKNHVFFMEAMKSRFIPIINQVHKEIEKGIIRDIVSIENHFQSIVPYDEHSYIYDPKQGGALYDIGIYNIATVLDFVKSSVVSISNDVKVEHGVDVHDSITLEFENGVKAFMEASLDGPVRKDMIITGTKGTITLDPFYRPTKAVISFNGESFTGEIPYDIDDFHTEIEACHEAIAYIKVESDRMSHQDSIDCIELMERIGETICRS